MNLIELLDKSAATWPDKPAFIEGENRVTYSALATQVHSIAAVFSELSLQPYSRIGLHFPNSIAYVELTFALWKLNVVVVPVPVEGTDGEMAEIVESLQLDAIVSPTPRSNSIQVQPDCHLTRYARNPRASHHDLNLAFIRFTSGTTSARKGVALTHETIRDRVVTANKALEITSNDTVIWTLPMSHHFLVTIVLYLSQGATVVLARHVLATPFLDAVQRWRGTVLYASPFHYAMLAQDKSSTAISTVRLAVSTTCAISEEVAREFEKRFHLPLSQALGIIELGMVSLNSTDASGRWNSVGRPLPDFEVQLLSPDETGAGELAIRGPGMFDAYAAPWMPRELVAPDGWFLTGDIARFDGDGYLYLLSRKTAVINLAGRKVFPEEIEAVLNRHPAVRESRVYGRPHPHLGEVIEAELVLDGEASALDSIRAHCRAHLASYKIPSRLHIVTELPRTSVTGKIRREPVAAV
ncbi:MAG: AMP-binding protein [Verrucomicrobia bacterium]|nr:AMP-binding protein [Verrucomicrobiota bacterium]